MVDDRDNPIVLPEGVTNRTEAGAVEIFENVMTMDTAKKIISAVEQAVINEKCPTHYQYATIGENRDHGGSYRSNSVLTIKSHDDANGYRCDCELDKAEEYLKSIFVPCVNFYQYKYNVQVAFDEDFQLLKYGPGREYKEHADQGPGADQRIVSGIIYLNPWEYEGGSTYFPNYNLNVNPELPSVVLFPSNYAYTHRAKAVLSGTKYAIVTWMWPPWAERPEWLR